MWSRNVFAFHFQTKNKKRKEKNERYVTIGSKKQATNAPNNLQTKLNNDKSKRDIDFTVLSRHDHVEYWIYLLWGLKQNQRKKTYIK